jgi:putative transposase
VRTYGGWVYVAFVVDVFSRYVVGWQVSRSLHTQLALDALTMAYWRRQGNDLAGLIHHSDRGGQYLSIRYTERLAEAGVIPSVGSKGDSYDNALAESFNGLYKAELIWHQGPWTGLEEVERATLEYVDWFNTRRLHGELGMVPPAEFEARYRQQLVLDPTKDGAPGASQRSEPPASGVEALLAPADPAGPLPASPDSTSYIFAPSLSMNRVIVGSQ